MNLKNIQIELAEAIEKSKNKRNLNEILEKLKNKSVIIYGAGYAGKFIYNILKSYSINIKAFLDIKASEGETLYNIPVYTPDYDRLLEEDKREVVVIVAVLCEFSEHMKIIEKIKYFGYKNVISCQEKVLSFRGIGDHKSLILDHTFYETKKDDILKCAELWEDEISLRTYKNNVKTYILKDFNEVEEQVLHEQYFPPDIVFTKGYSRFVDCGAYDGDTIQELVRLKGKVEALALFEPSMNSFEKLNKYIDDNLDDIADNAILYPCGVWSKTKMLQFNSEADKGSAISAQGNTYIQCVAIDNALKNFAPTFIKMDVEGAEYEALLGAEKTISKYKPDLAISVYHYADHLWDIPLLIDGWNLGYKFYLRTYWTCGHETVMYAVSDEREGSFDECKNCNQ